MDVYGWHGDESSDFPCDFRLYSLCKHCCEIPIGKKVCKEGMHLRFVFGELCSHLRHLGSQLPLEVVAVEFCVDDTKRLVLDCSRHKRHLFEEGLLGYRGAS